MATTLHVIDPSQQVDDDRERERVLELVRLGLPISAREFALVRRVGVSQFHRRAKRGAYDEFRIPGEPGPKHYSGVKVQRFLNGEPIEPEPDAFVFGRKTFGRN